ncbi:MAG: hypothetical protein LBR41_00360 [Rickettsiales bacterium]|nr:hypothetical protein [Rickettsiales bacterium]
MKRYFLTSLAALIMAACTPEPEVQPTPQKPIVDNPQKPEPAKKTSETIKVGNTAELDAAMQTPAKENHTIYVEWQNDMLVNNKTDGSIGNAQNIDDARRDLKMRANGHKIVYENEVVYHADWVKDTRAFAIGADTKHQAANKIEQKLWAGSGYDVPVVETAAAFDLGAENAARFDEYIAELKAQYLNQIVKLDMGRHTVVVRKETLADLSADDIPGGTIVVSNFKAAEIRSRDGEWSLGAGYNTAQWDGLSCRNGCVPEHVVYGRTREEYFLNFAKIIIGGVTQENKITDFIDGQGTTGTRIALSQSALPTRAATLESPTGARMPAMLRYEFDIGMYCIGLNASDEWNDAMIQNPVHAADKLRNRAAIYDKLQASGMHPINKLQSQFPMHAYSASEMRAMGKKPISMPSRTIQTRNNSVAHMRINARNARGRGQ